MYAIPAQHRVRVPVLSVLAYLQAPLQSGAIRSVTNQNPLCNPHDKAPFFNGLSFDALVRGTFDIGSTTFLSRIMFAR